MFKRKLARLGQMFAAYSMERAAKKEKEQQPFVTLAFGAVGKGRGDGRRKFAGTDLLLNPMLHQQGTLSLTACHSNTSPLRRDLFSKGHL